MLDRLRLSETDSSLTENQSDRVESALSAPGFSHELCLMAASQDCLSAELYGHLFEELNS